MRRVSEEATSPSRALFAARALIDELVRGGIGQYCIAPGSRSTALVLALAERGDVVRRVITDERSMAFFALGLARSRGEAVALVCTSGTAAANFAPAVVEAFLGGGALVLLTADRPPEERDRATAQTIDQAGLFGAHVRWATDFPLLACDETSARTYRSIAARAVAAAREGRGGPVHLNVALREPFFDGSYPAATRFDVGACDGSRPFTEVLRADSMMATGEARSLAERLRRHDRGLVVAAGSDVPAELVSAVAERLGWPILADPASGLRFGPHDRSLVVDAYEPLLRDPLVRSELAPAAVLRLGLTPVSKSLLRFLGESATREHVVVAEHGWPDPFCRASAVVRAGADALCRALVDALGSGQDGAEARATWRRVWLERSRAARRALEEALAGDGAPFDGVVLRALVSALPDGSTLILGNSLPVRDAETYLGASDKRLRCVANRGAAGIDGVVSTALGYAASGDAATALVVGDLSFLHDAGALAMAERERIPLLVVVVNDDGGGIFSFLPQRELGDTFERYFRTPHGADLARVAAVVGERFFRVAVGDDAGPVLAEALAARRLGPVVVEFVVDRERGRERSLAAVAAAQRAAAAAGAAA